MKSPSPMRDQTVVPTSSNSVMPPGSKSRMMPKRPTMQPLVEPSAAAAESGGFALSGSKTLRWFQIRLSSHSAGSPDMQEHRS